MSVPVTGLLTPYPLGTYAITDPLTGIDGWRSVADHTARNAIPVTNPGYCRLGMVVVTQNDLIPWQLNTATPVGTDADWTELAGSGGTITLSGDVSGTGTGTITVTVSSYNGGTAFGTMAAQDANAVAITGGTITGLPMPTGGSDAATKAYVDAFTTGLSPRQSCDAASTGAYTVTYNNGTAGVGATLTNAGTQAAFVIDGITETVGVRVLIKDQAAPAQNGIYTVTNTGSGSTNWVLTRATDYDQASASEVVEGSYTVISSGTVNLGRLFVETGVGPFTIGTTAIVFTQLFGAPVTTTLTGNVTGTGVGTIATTIANNAITTVMVQNSAVTLAKIANIPASRLLGNPTGATAVVQPISLGTNLSFSGSTLNAAGGGTVSSITQSTGILCTPNPITGVGTVGLATIATHTVLSNTTAGTATPAANTLTSIIDSSISSTRGTILYRGATVWSALAPGSAGQVLTAHGAGTDPTWGSAGGGGTVTSITAGTGLTATPVNPITGAGTIAFGSVANNTVLANVSGVASAPSAVTPSAVLDVIGATQGEVLFRDAGGWNVLAPGTSGQFLKTQGAAANPVWAAASGGSSAPLATLWFGLWSSLVVAAQVTQIRILTASGTFGGWRLGALTGPVGAAAIFDVLLSSDAGATWTSLWASTPANRPTIADGSASGSGTAFDTTTYSAGDWLIGSIIQAGSTTPGKNITLEIY